MLNCLLYSLSKSSLSPSNYSTSMDLMIISIVYVSPPDTTNHTCKSLWYCPASLYHLSNLLSILKVAKMDGVQLINCLRENSFQCSVCTVKHRIVYSVCAQCSVFTEFFCLQQTIEYRLKIWSATSEWPIQLPTSQPLWSVINRAYPV